MKFYELNLEKVYYKIEFNYIYLYKLIIDI